MRHCRVWFVVIEISQRNGKYRLFDCRDRFSIGRLRTGLLRIQIPAKNEGHQIERGLIMRRIKLICLVSIVKVFAIIQPAFACGVCYGNSNTSSALMALKVSVASLLAILLGVVGCFIWFFVQMGKRTKNIDLAK